jgi:plastocyanin
MNNRLKGLIGVLGLMLLPAAASASSKSVWMGVPPTSQKAFAKLGADADAFFPNVINIHRGDTISFIPAGFHTVDLPKKGGAALPSASPSGRTIAGDNDPAGNPYWFNGQPDIQFTAALTPPNLTYGKKLSYNGRKAVRSGLPLGAKLKPLNVRFTKTGTFTYYCNVHPGMKGKVRVLASRKKVPSVRAENKAVKKQVNADLKIAKSLQNPTVDATSVLVGNAGRGGVEVFAMFPAKKTVPVGTTLKFTMSPKSFEAHTATTGPGDPEKEPNSFLGKLSGSVVGRPPFDQAAVYPSDQPPGPASLTPSLHGNGFWNTGFLDSAAATPPPASGQVKLAAAGTYNFYCLIHPFMKAVVTVS